MCMHVLLYVFVCLNRVFRESSGISPVVRLTHSRDHTQRVVFAAHKVREREREKRERSIVNGSFITKTSTI